LLKSWGFKISELYKSRNVDIKGRIWTEKKKKRDDQISGPKVRERWGIAKRNHFIVDRT